MTTRIEPESSSGYPYCDVTGKETEMDVMAKLTSKGQITLPKAVRDALELEAGDTVLFRVEEGESEEGSRGRRALLSKVPDFISLAGSVPVPPELKGASWEEIRKRAREAWIREYR
jgi:antitoxin PrlF